VQESALNNNDFGSGNTAMGSGAEVAATGNKNVYWCQMNGIAGESNSCYIASILAIPPPAGFRFSSIR
jgi:hypothetical protein